ncbi:SCP-like protein [Oesophagostomum dentatum]|uniref:SCP-like protein n=1 Tax=Oesophagostomum dentatum TaxID=61180 RepID=A0A0B1TF03_OESDE|nr:SCP-like protein [Oesophagostomum dentatum]
MPDRLPITRTLISYSFLLAIIKCHCLGAFFECTDRGNTSSMTPDLRIILLAKHNALRSMLALGAAKHSPRKDLFCKPASKMPPLNYSCELERSAYDRANRCANMEPSPDYQFIENHRKDFKPRASLEKALPANVQLWWSEIIKLEQPIDQIQNVYRSNREIDSFAKMASDLTTEVGCSIVKCGGESYNFVCHYKTTLKEGEKLYTMGTTCTECPGGVKNCANGLCIIARR